HRVIATQSCPPPERKPAAQTPIELPQRALPFVFAVMPLVENGTNAILMKILFLTGSHTDPASRFRIWQFLEPLSSLGHHVKVRVPWPDRLWGSRSRGSLTQRARSFSGTMCRMASTLWNLRDAPSYDVIMMNRNLIPEPRISFLEAWLAKQNPRLIFDF